MTQLRSVNTHFWKDGFIADCTPLERYIFLYLLTNEATTLAGCYEISLRRIMFDTGSTKAVASRAMEKFINAGKIEFRDGWLVLNSFHKHQNLNGNMGIAAAKVLLGAPEWVGKRTRTNLLRYGTLPEWFVNHYETIKGREGKGIEDEVEKEGKPPAPVEMFIAEVIEGVKKELGLKKLSGADTRDWENHASLAHENEFLVSDFLETFSLLRRQLWRSGPVSPKEVNKNISNLPKLRKEIEEQDGKNRNGSGDSESTSEALRRIRATPSEVPTVQ